MNGPLILPMGLFGPGYRPRSGSSDVHSDWLRMRRWSGLVGAMIFPLTLMGLATVTPAHAFETLMRPIVFWTLLACMLLVPMAIGRVWAHRRRDALRPVPWREPGLDARLASGLLAAPTGPVRAQSGLLSMVWLGIVALGLSLAMDHPWTFGPLTLGSILLCAVMLRLLVLGERPRGGDPARDRNSA